MKEKTTFCLGLPISRNPSGQDEASWVTKLGSKSGLNLLSHMSPLISTKKLPSLNPKLSWLRQYFPPRQLSQRFRVKWP